MLKLMRLEAQRINLRVYFLTALILGGILLLFAYFTANAARVTGETEFMNYRNILQFTCVISLLLFSILAAVMYNNVVIKEYSGKRLSLLFSYPSDRKKIFMAKIIMVFSLIFGLMLLCTVIHRDIFNHGIICSHNRGYHNSGPVIINVRIDISCRTVCEYDWNIRYGNRVHQKIGYRSPDSSFCFIRNLRQYYYYYRQQPVYGIACCRNIDFCCYYHTCYAG